MTNGSERAVAGAGPDLPAYGAWLAWGWVALVVLGTLAAVLGWVDVELALDVQRHLS